MKKQPITMTRVLATYLAVLLLAACSPKIEHHNPNQIKVGNMDVYHSVYFDKSRAQVSSSEMRTLDDFISRIPTPAIKRITIEADNSKSVNRKRAHTVKHMLTKRGVPARHMDFASASDLDSGEVVVNVSYTVAQAPENCPNWSKYSVSNHFNMPHSNFGCAYRTNLAAMVMDPMDLVQGKGNVTPSPDRGAIAIDRYRKMEPLDGVTKTEQFTLSE